MAMLGKSVSKDNMLSVQQKVTAMIASDTIIIFSKTYCSYCKTVKEILSKMQYQYTAIELDLLPDAVIIQNYLEQLTGARTVPRVFFKGRCLGGCTDIQNLYESGRLKSLLENQSTHNI